MKVVRESEHVLERRVCSRCKSTTRSSGGGEPSGGAGKRRDWLSSGERWRNRRGEIKKGKRSYHSVLCSRDASRRIRRTDRLNHKSLRPDCHHRSEHQLRRKNGVESLPSLFAVPDLLINPLYCMSDGCLGNQDSPKLCTIRFWTK